jgi:predicted methyltransferase
VTDFSYRCHTEARELSINPDLNQMTRPLSLPQQAHAILQTHLANGDRVIDATVGNGHDSLFLAQQIAPTGLVYSFDIQTAAIAATQQRLMAAGLLDSVRLIHASHAQMTDFIPAQQQGNIKAIMFNLGYLPRGDKSIMTQTDSTLLALAAATELLAPDGIMTILAYPGHAGGDSETEHVASWCAQRSTENFSFRVILSAEPKASAPRLFVLQKSTASR